MLAEVGSSLIYSTICLKYHLYLKNFLSAKLFKEKSYARS